MNKIKSTNEYKIGDYMMICVRFEWNIYKFKKLESSSCEPFKILKTIRPNTYFFELWHGVYVSFLFNVEAILTFQGVWEFID